MTAPPPSPARATVGIAFALLFSMMAAHAALESARDALLLRAFSPDALLWSYVVIAVFALTLTRLPERRRPASLPRVLAVGALVPLAFWLALPALGRLGTAVLYVYSAIYATIAVSRFWLLLAHRFTVRDAKRHYAWIGVGGIGGAAVGSAVSAGLLTVLPVRDLLLASALFSAVAAVVARALARSAAAAAPPPARTTPGAASRAPGGSQAYLRRLVIVSLLASATVTVIDYLFKSVAAATLPPDELASYFARTYAGMNTVALAAQVLLAPILLRRLGTHAAAALLPTLILAASGGFALLGWPALALTAKGADGALRNSIHRVTAELFYFPLSDDVRQRWKARSDAFGQRGGQALGALVLLALVAVGGTERWVGLLAAALAVAWLIAARSMRAPYTALFREGLRRGLVPVDVQPLSSDTLQAVMEAFSSRDPAIVCSAIDFLVHHGHERLLPSVLVHHPSQRVALRALEAIARARPGELDEVARPLRTHPDEAVRAATIRLLMRQRRDPEEALPALADPSAEVRMTALLILRSRAPHRARAELLIDAAARGEPEGAELALARAIHADPHAELVPVLLRLLDTPVVEVRREALRALALLPQPELLARVRPLLADRRLLPDVRPVIVAASLGDSSEVERWLRDEALPRGVRRHVPRTLALFGSEAAAAALVTRLEQEPDGAVRFKILRALGRMRADRPSLALDDAVLRRYALACLERAIVLLGHRVSLEAAPLDARAFALLVPLLRDKELHALERVFRAIGVVQPELELEDVWRGIHAPDARTQAAALEVVEMMEPELRHRLLALIQPAPDRDRLRAVGGQAQPRARTLDALVADRSRALSALATALRQEAR